MKMYHVIYDGNCNLCVSLVKTLEAIDRGQQFIYSPMQDQATLAQLGITAADCERGMILVDRTLPERRWQGSDAAEEIGKLLPLSRPIVEAYRALPGLKWAGDRVYEQVRDHRYQLFGKRDQTYRSPHATCKTNCSPFK